MSTHPLLYLIVGAAGSGRRGLIGDLVQGALETGDRAQVILPADETPASAAPEDPLFADAARWSLDGETARVEFSKESTHLFLLLDGRGNPVDQLEALSKWLRSAPVTLGRVLCVVDCALLAKHAELLPWYDACIHFSDVVLLAGRQGVENKWVSDFQKRYRSQFLPCLFESLKNGHVRNPALILEPEARRISQAFDADEWGAMDLAGVEIGGDDESDSVPAGEDASTGEGAPSVDRYFERRPGGTRVITLPQIARFLE